MNTDSTPFVALVEAVSIAGSQSELARIVGVTQQAVSGWIAKGRPLPAEHVLAVEAATGISRHVLRPDIYPIENTASPGPQPGVTPSAGSEFQAAGGVSTTEVGGRRS